MAGSGGAGGSVGGVTADLSEGGLGVRLATRIDPGTEVLVSVESDFARVEGVRARVAQGPPDEGLTRLEFIDVTPVQDRRLIELMFSDPDGWIHQPIPQRPLRSLGLLLVAPWRAVAHAVHGAVSR